MKVLKTVVALMPLLLWALFCHMFSVGIVVAAIGGSVCGQVAGVMLFWIWWGNS